MEGQNIDAPSQGVMNSTTGSLPRTSLTGPYFGYEFFNRGITADETQQAAIPCDQWFVDALLRDTWREVYNLAYSLPSMILADAKLPLLEHKRAKTLIYLIAECRRLHQATELFSSAVSRQNFELQLQIIAEVLHELNIKSELFLEDDEETLKPLTAYAIKLGGMWFRLNQARPWKEPELPRLHPRNRKIMNPWNKWLNNFDTEHLISGEYKEIKQIIPACAIKLLHRARFMYGTVERSYSLGGRVTREEKNAAELEEATGEDHVVSSFSFMMMQRNLRCYKSEVRGDKIKGVISLAGLSTILCRFQRKPIPFDTNENWEMIISRTEW